MFLLFLRHQDKKICINLRCSDVDIANWICRTFITSTLFKSRYCLLIGVFIQQKKRFIRFVLIVNGSSKNLDLKKLILLAQFNNQIKLTCIIPVLKRIFFRSTILKMVSFVVKKPWKYFLFYFITLLKYSRRNIQNKFFLFVLLLCLYLSFRHVTMFVFVKKSCFKIYILQLLNLNLDDFGYQSAITSKGAISYKLNFIFLP